MGVLTPFSHVTDSRAQNPVSQTIALIFNFSIVFLINYGGNSFSKIFKKIFILFSNRRPRLDPGATDGDSTGDNF